MKKISKVVILVIILVTYFYISPVFIYADDVDENDNFGEYIDIVNIENKNNLKNLKINSKNAVAIDRKSKRILYKKNENIKVPMASTTKIMTAIILVENGNLNDTITISKKAANTGGSRLGLNVNDKISVNDLLYGLLLRSGNDSAIAIAEYVAGNVQNFANLMNEKARSLGLENTNFITPHGLDNDNHYTTAYELAIIADYALNNNKIKEVVGTEVYNIKINNCNKTLKNTNELLGNLEGIYGVKTGFTNKAGRCLVTACNKDNLDIIVVVLGADTKKNRTKDSIDIIKNIQNEYKNYNINYEINQKFNEWNNKNDIMISKGKKKKLDIYIENKDNIIPLTEEELKNLKYEFIIYNKTLEAPIYVNQEIGKIEVKINNKVYSTIMILSKDNVKEKKLFDYLTDFTYYLYNDNVIEKNNG